MMPATLGAAERRQGPLIAGAVAAAAEKLFAAPFVSP